VISGLILAMALLMPIKMDTYIAEEYQVYAYEVAKEYNLEPELVVAMIEAESSGRASVVSSAKCIGLMQISPKWHKDRMEKLGVDDLTDAYGNISVGCDFVAELFEKYEDVYAVLMAYNEGEYSGAIKRAKDGEYSNYAKKIVARCEELKESTKAKPICDKGRSRK
jgi:soluble lytic murein transglycosylase-like protein